MWHKMLMTNLCFEQIASLIINDKTKVRTKILLSPVQDLNRLTVILMNIDLMNI